ncbi:MAG: hypothetical protein KME15_01665 [Drouetiella hepatica Uher 2000/2452]|jgi:hypothetical protein|uniref:Uncharacterized protein n=1 Tax=Drouetiella hepatica Uher 2000/2452 TaxID=904376 RepID=A0A951Q8W9_9CYAN|nr:hypothetical protein [Drouetiella hepatica Uher 2000/2452]
MYTLKRVMDSQAQVSKQPRFILQAFTGNDFDFDLWALAVRQQMMATLKKREGSRSNWGRIQQH